MKYICPVCNKILKAPAHEKPEEMRFYPFCSRRCKLIDLGNWFDSKYRITSKPQSEDSEESADTSSGISCKQ